MTSDAFPQIEQPLGRILSVLGKGYLRILRTRLKHLDIDRNYYALVLVEARDGDISQQELAGLLDSDKVSIVRVVDYLAGKGYLTRINKAGDRRKHCLELTGKAKQALPEIRAAFREINALVLEGLEKQQLSVLTEAIHKIKTNINENIRNI
jgi:MarR family transcriptional regulator for hemolysin